MPMLAVERRAVERVLQRLNLADHAQAREVMRIVHDGDAGRVIAAILEPSQPFHEERHDVSLGDCADDSTHDYRVLVASGGIPQFC